MFLTIFVNFIPAEPACGEGLARQDLLRDGFVLRGIEGKVTNPDGDKWFFAPGSDVTEDGTVIEKGTKLQLLSSATLEKIAMDLQNRPSATYQLWGRTTEYKGKNFIFPFYFLPLSKIKKPQIETQQTPQEPQPQEPKPIETPVAAKEEQETFISEPNDVLDIPQEIIEKLKIETAEPARSSDTDTGREAKTIIQKSPIKKADQAFQQDSVLAGRTALLVRQDDGGLVFILDAFGRNAAEVPLRLLPCEALELTEQRQSDELEPLRFKIAGIMTKYKGDNYLLLQKATRVYSYGNFTR